VHNTFLVELSNSQNNLNGIKFDKLFGKSFLFLENLIQLTTSDKRHNKIKTRLWLEQEVHPTQVGVVCSKQNIFLEQSRGNLIILQQDVFANDFYRVQFLGTFQLSQENFSKGASAQLADKVERIKIHLLRSPWF